MSLSEIILGAQQTLDALPEPIKQPFFKAVGQLLGGLTSLPSAWTKRHSQAVEDLTAARSLVTSALAKAVADGVVKNPEIIRAAAEIMLPANVRKARNLVAVVQAAGEHIGTSAPDGAEPDAPEDDWTARFMRYAEDASSERLQDLFGRILAGEIVKPGSFSTSTLRAVSELDQSIALDFSSAWANSVGDKVDYDEYWQRGSGFLQWKRLTEAGLMAPSATVMYLPKFQPLPIFGGNSAWSPMNVDGFTVLVFFQQGCASSWQHIDFTRVGREIGSLLPRPDYASNMRQAARRLPMAGLTQVQLQTLGKPPELIFPAAPV